MRNDWVTIMKKNKRLKLTIFQTLTHYGIVLLLLFIATLTGWSLVEIYFTDTYSGVQTANELINVSLLFLVLALIFVVIQYRRLSFKEFQMSYTDEQFQEAIERTINDLQWQVEKNNKTFFRAVRVWDWTGSLGEMVTIIKDKDRILINNICDPDHISSVFSYGWNRKNIKTFIKHLSDILNNRSIELKEVKEINE